MNRYLTIGCVSLGVFPLLFSPAPDEKKEIRIDD